LVKLLYHNLHFCGWDAMPFNLNLNWYLYFNNLIWFFSYYFKLINIIAINQF
jgi:hypothetical protein